MVFNQAVSTWPPSALSGTPAGQVRRMAIYCHDTYGLGRLRRCLKICRAFRDSYPHLSILLLTRPEYYLVGLGVNPFTYKRVALVRIPSTSIHLFVDVGEAIQGVSKNARRKAMRHGRLRNGVLMEKIDESWKLAVAYWWTTKR